MIVLIPAYEPDHRLVDLVRSVREIDPDLTLVVVDDGSGPGHAGVFDATRALGADVISHHPNRGKGFALKAGFAHIASRYPGHDVVCADCDGQHALTDVLNVAEVVRRDRGSGVGIVLGVRAFVGDVPLKSRFGNALTRHVLRILTGLDLTDTQTGLRGYPAEVLPWLGTIGGDRFEYELETLLAAQRHGIDVREVPIETIYLDGNASSHFRPVRDSVRVYRPFLRFVSSSLLAFTVDVGVFFAAMATTGNLAVSVVGARLTSAAVNFTTNRCTVFSRSGPRRRTQLRRYATLATGVLAANYVALVLTTRVLGLPLVPAKVLTEAALFIAGFRFQQRWVFNGTPGETADSQEPPAEPSVTAEPVAVGSTH